MHRHASITTRQKPDGPQLVLKHDARRLHGITLRARPTKPGRFVITITGPAGTETVASLIADAGETKTWKHAGTLGAKELRVSFEGDQPKTTAAVEFTARVESLL